jgi:hypothetical protein
MKPGSAIAAVALALVAGSVFAAQGGAEPSPPGADPALASWADWSFLVTCGSPEEAFDPLLAFSGPTGAESGSSPAEQGLRRAIKEQQSWAEPLITGRGWRLIAETETRAQFSRGRLSGTLEWVTLERKEDGSWLLASYSSDCDPTTTLPGRAVVTWSLDQKQKHLTPRSRILWIDLGPGECDGGARQNPRAGFRFHVLGNKLLMTASLDPIRRGGTCIGTIEKARKVRLPFPLGGFRLYDGSTFPPVPAGKTRTRY